MISQTLVVCLGAVLLASPGFGALSTNPDDMQFFYYE